MIKACGWCLAHSRAPHNENRCHRPVPDDDFAVPSANQDQVAECALETADQSVRMENSHSLEASWSGSIPLHNPCRLSPSSFGDDPMITR